MKISNLLFLSVFCFGCNSASMDKPVDKRPATELAFIKKVNNADSVYMLSDNEIKKAETIETGKTEVINFIVDSLAAQVKNWDAVVSKIEVDKLTTGYVNVTLLIPTSKFLDEKVSDSNAIILYAKVDMSNDKLKNALKEMKNGDKVLINGSFEKDVVGHIDFSGNRDDVRDSFSSPLFKFQIDNIVKKGQ